MEAIKKIIKFPMGIFAAKSSKGTYAPARQRIIELYDNCFNQETFQGLESKRRRRDNVLDAWENSIWFELKEPGVIPYYATDDLCYYFDDTPGASIGPFPEPKDPNNCEPHAVSHLKIIDNQDPKYQGKNLIFATPDGKMIAYILSRRDRGRISLRKWKRHLNTLKLSVKTQRNSPRGIRKSGCYSRYLMFGFRRDGNGRTVRKYVPKPYAKKSEVKEANRGIQELMRDLEYVGLNLVPDFELSVQNHLREKETLGAVLLNGFEGRFTQMAIAMNYWSPCHVDDDVFRTLLSCYCESVMNKINCNDILFYFCFPSAGIAIPMRSTDILVFDSKFPHCASNYRVKDTFIFSCFTFAKTTNAHLTANASVIHSVSNNASKS